MQSVIIRKKMLQLGYVGSEFIRLQKNKTYSNCNKFIQDLGWQKIMLSLFNENIDSNSIENSSLYKSYEFLLKDSKIQNEEFIKAYKINDSLALFLDANIYLFHLFPKGEICTDVVPWYYTDGQVYLGDTWWEQDDEIFEDIHSLSIIDFYEKYKGWCFSNKRLF